MNKTIQKLEEMKKKEISNDRVKQLQDQVLKQVQQEKQQQKGKER